MGVLFRAVARSFFFGLCGLIFFVYFPALGFSEFFVKAAFLFGALMSVLVILCLGAILFARSNNVKLLLSERRHGREERKCSDQNRGFQSRSPFWFSFSSGFLTF